MEWQNRLVLVSGAGGFIASHLVEELARRNARVRALVHYNSRGDLGNLRYLDAEVMERVEVVRGDVTDGYQLRSFLAGIDTAFHLAALIGIPYSYQAPKAYLDVNTGGTLNILQGCRDENVRRLVHLSSSEVYGTARYVPIDENHPLQPQSPYAATKVSADSLVESFGRSFELPVTIIRPFNNYGPRQSMRAVIPTIIAQALTHKRVVLGNLLPVRDFLFVKDTVRGIVAAAGEDRCIGEVINLGTGVGISIGQLVEKVRDLVGEDVEIEQSPERFRPEQSEVMNLICSSAKAADLMNWKPNWDLTAGLRETIEFVAQNPRNFSSSEYGV